MRCAAALLAAASRAAGLRRVTAVQNKPAATTTTIPATAIVRSRISGSSSVSLSLFPVESHQTPHR